MTNEINAMIDTYYDDNSEFFVAEPCYEEQAYDSWVEAALLEME